jgi:hypothetical protein
MARRDLAAAQHPQREILNEVVAADAGMAKERRQDEDQHGRDHDPEQRRAVASIEGAPPPS